MGNEFSREELQLELIQLTWKLAFDRDFHSMLNPPQSIYSNDINSNIKAVQSVSTLDDTAEATSRVYDSTKGCDENKSEKLKNYQQYAASFQSFDIEFVGNYFKECPDLRNRFAKEILIVAKMITGFIKGIIFNKSKVDAMISRFVKSHARYALEKKHFQGFTKAIVTTVVSRLGRFGSPKIQELWTKVSTVLRKRMWKVNL
mmetsp:Transcript_11814/g.16345  ORF Transcript_11814/g.16345 Transcript_11814/m.16345 type:complete len:202 (-) Transcript_11814:660-1265(-)